MGTGVSLFFVAVGAILTFAVDTDADGFNLDATGIILMLLGLFGLLWSMMVWDDWRPLRRRYDDDVVVRRTVVDDPPVVRRERVVADHDLVEEDVPVRRSVRRISR